MGKLKVLDGGMFTTIQDLGRPGFRNIGVPSSGIMDSKSAKWANRLVGNDEGSPVLEMTLKGGKYQFDSEAVIAITGADMNIWLNGKQINRDECLLTEENDVLEVGFGEKGCRCYLAIQGQWELSKVMNSYSTLTTAKFGGLLGRALKKGDEIGWENAGLNYKYQSIPDSERTYYSSKLDVPIYPAPEWEWLDQNSQDRFLSTEFEVSAKSNRMGIRLEGTSIEGPDKEMISSPVIPGIIQLPADGNPIILMNDGQTIGGYPRIAKIPDHLLWRLGQLKPGDTVRFTKFE